MEANTLNEVLLCAQINLSQFDPQLVSYQVIIITVPNNYPKNGASGY